MSKNLKIKAKKNTTVQYDEDNVIKEGEPLDHAVRHNPTGKTVGVAIGTTRNMGNYESLRLDTWLTDTIQPEETHEEALKRVKDVAFDCLVDMVEEYANK